MLPEWENLPKPTNWEDPLFRKVCGIIVVHNGKVLVGERKDYAGAWQFPQGGLEEGETWREGALRELEEETAITANQLRHVAECEELTYYLWIPKKKDDTQHGPLLRWNLFEFTGDPAKIDVSKATWDEFSAHKWVDPEWIIKHVADFRRPGYTVALRAFAAEIAATKNS